MDVFELDEKLLGDYRRFARSFTQIRAKDISDGVDRIYGTDQGPGALGQGETHAT